MTVIRPNSIAGITSLTALGTAIDFYNVNGAGIAFNNVNLNNTSGVSTFSSVRATSIVGVSTIGVTTAYVTSINDGPISGFRNRIINGDMRVDQRLAGVSTTASVGALTYAVDRTFVYPVGANLTVQRVAGTNTGTPYSLRLTGASGNTQTNIGQRIENLNVLDLNSKKVTVSCIIYASTSVSNVSITLFYCSSDNSGYGATSDSQSITVSSGINNISKTFTLPSTASRGFEAAIVFASGIGSGVTVEVTNLQIEEGPVASPFERRDFGQELFLCQRYYEKSFNLATVPTQAVGSGAGAFQTVQVVGQSAAQYCGSVSFKVRKRATPSVVTLYNPISANAQFYNANSGGSTSSTAASDISEAGFHLNTITQAGSGAAGNGLFIHWSASAEL